MNNSLGSITLKNIFIEGLTTLLGLLYFFAGIAPVMIYSFTHIGANICIFLGTALIMIPIIHKKFPNIFIKIIWWITVIIGTGALIFGSYMALFGSFNSFDNSTETPTVIVLGAGVNKGKLSFSLVERLDEANRILLEYPNAVCIVSGGNDDKANATEADLMKKYLMDKGIEEDRIIKENKSTNTEENIKYSKDIIENEKLSEKIIIVTERFHQYRSNLYAKKYKINTFSSSAKSPIGMSYGYYIYEMLAIIKGFILN